MGKNFRLSCMPTYFQMNFNGNVIARYHEKEMRTRFNKVVRASIQCPRRENPSEDLPHSSNAALRLWCRTKRRPCCTGEERPLLRPETVGLPRRRQTAFRPL